jgi:acetylornithine deacetylase/succinyl-diaminopimelate desuccinylase-like protein
MSGVTVSERIDARAEEFLGWLLRFAAMPSISATGEGITETAEALAELMRSLGITVELLDTGHHPIVWGTIGEGDTHALFYGHYDVVPPGPLEDWETPPFEPTIRDGAVWGRGVGDNKGQLLAHLAALAAWLDVHGEPPPLRIDFVFDGEDEIGSAATARYVAAHPERFAGDFLICADASTLGLWDPAMFLGIRGALYVELRAQGAGEEWHSGSYGGILPNPVERLARAVASLSDGERVRIPGFYDGVEPPDPRALELAAELPPGYLSDPAEFGVGAFVTDDPRANMFFTPRLCVCGLQGGYGGEGMKMAVPTHAVAKLDFTLLPGQRPSRIAERLRAHLDAEGFADVTLEVLADCPPSVVPPGHPVVATVASALASVWGRPPVVFPSIGGGGVFAAFAEHVGLPCLVVPYAQADLQEHSVREHLALEWFHNGIKTSAELFSRL